MEMHPFTRYSRGFWNNLERDERLRIAVGGIERDEWQQLRYSRTYHGRNSVIGRLEHMNLGNRANAIAAAFAAELREYLSQLPDFPEHHRKTPVRTAVSEAIDRLQTVTNASELAEALEHAFKEMP